MNFVIHSRTEAVGPSGTMVRLRSADYPGCEGTATITGPRPLVDHVIERLTKPPVAAAGSELLPPAPVWVRFVLVDSRGNHYAMAFTLNAGTTIGLEEIEQIENFATKKVGEQMLAVNWVIVPAPKATKVVAQEPVSGSDGAPAAVEEPGELVDVPEAGPRRIEMPSSEPIPADGEKQP